MDTQVLNQRQIQILKVMIEEYMETALPVGSETLDRKYNLGVSPATIRNEMVKLTQMGYIKQPHTSAGRVPSPKGIRFYVENLVKPKELTVAEEVAVKQKVWDYRHELDKLLRETTHILAQRTKSVSLITTEDGDLYYSGASYLFEAPEFYNIELARSVFEIIEEYEYWKRMCYKNEDNESYKIIMGDEMGETFSSCSMVYNTFVIPGHGLTSVGVIGSNRLNYSYVIPFLQYISKLIKEISTF